MSQPIDMAVRINMTVLQSIETAVRRDILWYRVNRASLRRDITVSQSCEKALGEILQCYSQWRWLLG